MAEESILEGMLEKSVSHGFDRNLNIEYENVTDGEVEVSVTVDQGLMQPAGIVHGGVLCSIVESVGSAGGTAWALENVKDGAFVGVSNATEFFRSVKQGRLKAIGSPLHQGSSTQVWRVEIYQDKTCELVAAGTLRGQNVSRK